MTRYGNMIILSVPSTAWQVEHLSSPCAVLEVLGIQSRLWEKVKGSIALGGLRLPG